MSASQPARLSVNRDRLVSDLESLGRIGRAPAGGLDRSSFSLVDLEARRWYLARCADAGLSVAIDGIGNLLVSSPGLPDDIAARPPVWSGSHIDTVPNGGAFDGAVGALAALECLRRIREEGIDLARPVCAVVYTDEEGNYAHLLGSSALARGFSRAELDAMVGRDGDRFVDTFAAAGGDPDAAAAVRLGEHAVHAAVELHIEQGPILEESGLDIGVVTGIVGWGGGTVTFRGRADHAGTTPMMVRKDALLGAAAFILALPGIAASVSDRAVVTSGIVRVAPGSSNVVPGEVQVTVDFRDLDADRIAGLEAGIIDAARSAARKVALDVDIDLGDTIPPALMDSGVQGVIQTAASARGLSSTSMPSGAGHDSQNMATIAPTGMIFIPSIGGRSHCPEENTAWSDVGNGANVLLDSLIELARS